ncbi:signal peptidase I [Bacillus solimangrovi]|uniref:Signal peptidase I n=1 Tax=Bacillus solimangrovi TaxID=1305675 RepID=A0A1E5LAY6_9BACI|nr:signal peptidase I [Bacillus solimangrovi]OEH91242.1 signal peptidase I [Bacillus solimangrovi]
MAKGKSETWEWVKALLIAVALAAIIRYFFFAPIVVDGLSMMPTLHDQNRMIVNKFNYSIGKPQRFDVVVFEATEDKDYIKRVIGLPGDHVAYKDDVLYINGEQMNEPYLDELKKDVEGNLTYDFTLEELTGFDVVPEGELFVLGDNRRFSKDSRMIGTIPMERIIGEAQLVYWPLKDVVYMH